jgi:alkanesulfonate monooxygenase SsuD/methylene tetrahydromethanopterin reductase-like flavin-dependent oxidoreductase (luciferase family)
VGTARPRDEVLAPLFGISVAPTARDAEGIVALARLADDLGIDYFTLQDHPYNAGFVDTWTLLALLGGVTQRVRLMANVLNLPLRPPAMLAKSAASLDLLTHGRVEMGLGAGAFWDAIAAYGGPRRTPAEAVEALDEAMQIMRALWQPAAPDERVTFAGRQYQLDGARPGPPPAHRIGIWLGVIGPRMLRLLGRQADGWIVSAGYVPPAEVAEKQQIIDDAARAAGRAPHTIRRAYNLAGVVLEPGEAPMAPRRPGMIVGSAEQWAEELANYYRQLGMDTFIFWPAIRDHERQIRRFAERVIPAVRQAIGSGPS